MPYFRKTICSHPNCPNYAESGSRYCVEHKKRYAPSRDTTSKYEDYYHEGRFKKKRKLFLIAHPYCEECKRKGIWTLSNTLHHTHGFCDRATFYDEMWWEAWCKSCHSRLHTQVNNEELYKRFNK